MDSENPIMSNPEIKSSLTAKTSTNNNLSDNTNSNKSEMNEENILTVY